MTRRIPDRAMPHTAIVRPYLGTGARGHQWTDPRDPVRANFNPGSTAQGGGRSALVTVNGTEIAVAGHVFLDPMDLPLLSKVHSSLDDSELVVAQVKRWDGGGVSYLEVTLGSY